MPTPSNKLVPGTFKIPAFSLPDVVTGENVTDDSLAQSPASVVVFLCRHCPYVVHVMPKLIELASTYLPQGIRIIGISANDATSYPDDAPDKLKDMAQSQNIPFPILHDASQATARAFHAACTPEFFVFGPDRVLFYHGRMDPSTPGNGLPCTGDDLRQALDAVLDGKQAPAPQHPAMGCSIKWK